VKRFEDEREIPYREFLDRVAAQGVQLAKTATTVHLESCGDTEEIWMLQREMGDGQTLAAPICPMSDDETMAPTYVRSLCARLRLDMTVFGWTVVP
jgi:hypothetical protein